MWSKGITNVGVRELRSSGRRRKRLLGPPPDPWMETNSKTHNTKHEKRYYRHHQSSLLASNYCTFLNRTLTLANYYSMAKKKSPYGKKKYGKKAEQAVEEENLGRFAGSSDEEEDDHQPQDSDKKKTEISEPRVLVEHDADDEESYHDEERESKHKTDGVDNKADEPFVTNADSQVLEEDPEPGEKMAGVMARILGTTAHGQTNSVVLAKTTTPLQRLQQKEKEKMKALKNKRKANKERNLAALHIPLSVATTNDIGEGRLSITKELEHERFHRRVATRGVVALFNAICQHQNATEDDDVKSRKSDATKMTKHGFLDKIKNTAATMDSSKTSVEDKLKSGTDSKEKSTGKWDALKDDFMMKPKKNWDEESSDDEEEAGEFEEPEEISEVVEVEPARNKRRKVGARE